MLRGKQFLALLTTLIFTTTLCISMLPYLRGRQLTPPGYTYLGTVHYPTDYFYYLSQISQGEHHWLFADYIWGPEKIPASLVGWVFVFAGHLGHFFSLTPWVIYEIMIFVSVALYCLSAYYLLGHIFPNSKFKQTISLFFFLFATPFPHLINTASGFWFSYDRQWFNIGGDPFNRLDPAANHLIAPAAVMGIFSLIFLYDKHRTKKNYWLLLPLSILAAIIITLQPIQLMVVFLALAVHYGWRWVTSHQRFNRANLQELVRTFIPMIVMGISILPLFIYMNKIVAIPPYNAGKAFENSVQVHINPLVYLELYGPLGIIGLLALPFFLKGKNHSRHLLFIYSFIAFTIAISPFPEKIEVLNVRFLAAVEMLIFAAASTWGIFAVGNILKRFSVAITTLIIVLTSLMFVPAYTIELQKRISPDINNMEYYLPTPVYEAIVQAKNMTARDETILPLWPFEKITSALTGKRVLFWNENVTLDFEEKNKQAYYFVANQMTESGREEFLVKNNIRTIISYLGSIQSPPPYLVEKFKNNLMVVYRVELNDNR